MKNILLAVLLAISLASLAGCVVYDGPGGYESRPYTYSYPYSYSYPYAYRSYPYRYNYPYRPYYYGR
jgi:hypothetical protein